MEYNNDGLKRSELRFKTTKEGYLKGVAYVTTFNSVLKYPERNTLEFRPEKEVLSVKSLDSMKNKPVTIDHPNDFLNVNNTDKHIVGYTGDKVIIDGNKVGIDMTIISKDAIDAIRRGKRQLSLGYENKRISQPGTYENKDYTHIQTDIYYNHLSIVDFARAGNEVRINTDSTTSEDIIFNHDSIDILVEPEDLENQQTEVIMEKTENVETKDSEVLVENEILQESHIITKDSLNNAVKELSNILESLQKINNTDSSEVNLDSLIIEKTKERVKLFDNISKLSINTDSLHDKSNREIMEFALISKTKVQNFDGKSDDYVNARFDSLVENVKLEPIKRQMSKITETNDSVKPKSIVDIIQNNHLKFNSK